MHCVDCARSVPAPMNLKIEPPLPYHACRDNLGVLPYGEKAFCDVAVDVRKIVGKRGCDRFSLPNWIEDPLIRKVGSERNDDPVSDLFVSCGVCSEPRVLFHSLSNRHALVPFEPLSERLVSWFRIDVGQFQACAVERHCRFEGLLNESPLRAARPLFEHTTERLRDSYKSEDSGIVGRLPLHAHSCSTSFAADLCRRHALLFNCPQAA